MTNIRLNTTDEINDVLLGEKIENPTYQMIEGVNYIKVIEDAATIKWAQADLYEDYVTDCVEEEEEAPATEAGFFGAPARLDNLTFVLQTIGSRIENETVVASPEDITAYLTTGTLTHVETGDSLRNYTDVSNAVNGNPETKILFIKNKTGN